VNSIEFCNGGGALKTRMMTILGCQMFYDMSIHLDTIQLDGRTDGLLQQYRALHALHANTRLMKQVLRGEANTAHWL